MNTIKEIVTFQEIIKKSKFITYLYPISSLENAKTIIDTHKKQHAEVNPYHCDHDYRQVAIHAVRVVFAYEKRKHP